MMNSTQKMSFFLLLTCMFFTGASGIVVEFIIATTSTTILGNSVKQFSLILALMMLFMGVGGLASTRMSSEHLMFKFFTVEMCLTLIGSFSPIFLTWSYINLTSFFEIVLWLNISVIGFLIGLEIPIIMRIFEKLKIGLRINTGSVFFMEYLGSFVGSLVWVYVLLANFSLVEASFLTLFPNFIMAIITILWLNPEKKRFVIGTSCIIGLALTLGLMNVEKYQIQMDQHLYDAPIIHQETSKFQKIVLTYNPSISQSGMKGDLRLFLNGGLQISSIDNHHYSENLIHPVMSSHENPEKILVLGGGDGDALKEIWKYDSVKEVTIVDLDPAMIELARTHPKLVEMNNGAFEDSRLTIVHMDAMNFLMETSKKFDVIVVDLPDPKSIEISKLYSVQFYQVMKHHLNKFGRFVVQSTSPYHAEPIFLMIGNSLKTAGLQTIPYWDNVPSFGQWGWFTGCLENCKIKPNDLKVETFYLTPMKIFSNLNFSKRLEGLLHENSLGENIIMRPILHTLYDKQWQTY